MVLLARLAAPVIACLGLVAFAPGAGAQGAGESAFTFAPVPSIDGCPKCKALHDALAAIPREVAQLVALVASVDREERAYRQDLSAREARPGESDRAAAYGKKRLELLGRIATLRSSHARLLAELDACLKACRAPPAPPPVSQVPTIRGPTPSELMYEVWRGVTDGGAWLGMAAIFETMFPDDFGEKDPDIYFWERRKAEQVTTTSLCAECDPLVAPVLAALQARDKAKARFREIPDRLGETRAAMEGVRAKLGEVRDAVAKVQERLAGTTDPIAQNEILAEARLVGTRGDAPGRELEALMKAYTALKQEQVDLELRLPRLEDALEAAIDALALCNGRCKDVVISLDRVVGFVGTNPWDPRGLLGPRPDASPPGSAGALQFSAFGYSGGEGGVVTIFVVRSAGSKGAVSVRYAAEPRSASAADFAATGGTLSWADGETTPKFFTIALVDDTLVEGEENFRVLLSDPTGGAVLGDLGEAQVTIVDNDSPSTPEQFGSLQLAASAFTVAENGGVATIMVTRTGGTSGEVTAQFFTGPGSATAGSDYQAVSGVLTWRAGDATPKSFTVPIVNDTAVEGPETFFVTLNNPTGGARLGAPTTATVTINDDDVNSGPCGATGNAWTPNGGQYSCGGTCNPNPSPRLSINGDLVTATNFHAGGTATFPGCGPSLNSNESNLTYFGQANHRATITRMGDASFTANIVSSGGGSCAFTCNRTGP